MNARFNILIVLSILLTGCAVHRIYVQTKPDVPYFTTFQREKDLGFKENIIGESGDTVSVFEVWNTNPGRLDVYRACDSSEIGYVYLDPRDYPRTDTKRITYGWQGESNISKDDLVTASRSLLTVRLQRCKGVATAYLVFEYNNSPEPEDRHSSPGIMDSCVPDDSSCIKLSSNETNVDVLLDGLTIGQIRDTIFTKTISSGAHLLEAQKTSFQNMTIRIELRKDEILNYRFELVPAGNENQTTAQVQVVKHPTSTLRCLTSASDYSVRLEGSDLYPPFELKDIPSGRYEMTITRGNLQRRTFIIIEEGQTLTIDLDTDSRFSIE